MSLRRLRKSDVKDLSNTLPIDKKADVQVDDDVLLVNNELAFFRNEDEWVPSVKFLLKNLYIPTLVVDMGAVPHVAKGADIMRPGITEVPDGDVNAIVCIVDEKHSKPLGVGRLLFSGSEIREMESGKVVKMIHYVGDKLWQNYS